MNIESVRSSDCGDEEDTRQLQRVKSDAGAAVDAG
jgi:hypothetical protein